MEKLQPIMVEGNEPSDGVLLIFDDASMGQETLKQLRDWASYTDDDGPDRGGSLETLLSFDGLAFAAMAGVIGNAAFSVFPAAARWLQSKYLTKREQSEADVIAQAAGCMERLQPGSSASLVVEVIERRDDGTWLLEVQGGRPKVRYVLETSRTGAVVRARRRT